MNLRSHTLALPVALPLLAVAGGAVVNISSTAALRPSRSSPLVAYEATKAALIGALTRSAAVSAAMLGVCVNSVVPGIIDTACRRRDLGDAVIPMDDLIPMGRAGTPWEVAAVVAFLLHRKRHTSPGPKWW